MNIDLDVVDVKHSDVDFNQPRYINSILILEAPKSKTTSENMFTEIDILQ